MFGKGFILREENDMIIKSVNLETVCGITSKLPDNTLPEVAFAGKSNVGKSSLINALMNRKSYARISAQPGKTQTINYYNINEELSAALTKLTETEYQVKTATETMNLANENLDLVSFSYNEGKANMVDVLSAQLSWTQAHTNLINAYLSEKMAIAEYRRVISE